mmetsp:Transcript_21324/g.39188  ORF Transcript_21324/g.39188 Transcript_21324/m.39188 type:complete len:186 (-) Transcript_21324:19-576(-)
MLRATRFLMWRPIRTLQQRRDDMAIKRQQDTFKKFVTDLAAKDEYTLLDYKREILNNIKSNSSSWLKAFKQADPEEAELEKNRRLICAFKDEELLDESLITPTTKSEVAKVTGSTPEEVNKMLRLFKLNHNLHQYLKQRRVHGEPLPENEEDIRNMMQCDEQPGALKRPNVRRRRMSPTQMKYLA